MRQHQVAGAALQHQVQRHAGVAGHWAQQQVVAAGGDAGFGTWPGPGPARVTRRSWRQQRRALLSQTVGAGRAAGMRHDLHRVACQTRKPRGVPLISAQRSTYRLPLAWRRVSAWAWAWSAAARGRGDRATQRHRLGGGLGAGHRGLGTARDSSVGSARSPPGRWCAAGSRPRPHEGPHVFGLGRVWRDVHRHGRAMRPSCARLCGQRRCHRPRWHQQHIAVGPGALTRAASCSGASWAASARGGNSPTISTPRIGCAPAARVPSARAARRRR